MSISIKAIQRLLAAVGKYSGQRDGIIGPKTTRAIDAVLKDGGAVEWPVERRAIAAAQMILSDLGYEPGAIDGLCGHNTMSAFEAWDFERITGVEERVERDPIGWRGVPRVDLPLQRDVGRVYGEPGPEVESRLATVDLSFPLRLDWDLATSVTRVTLHRLCAPSFVDAMEAVRDHYGFDRMQKLGIDRYAGGYMHRRMRGGNKWSMHAYGCAVDFYAAPNGLRTRCPEALFCRPEYQPFLDIMEDHGWLPAIRLWGADAMHFQRARLG